MATETNDLNAHLISIQTKPNSVSLLNGQRFNNVNSWLANQRYRIPESNWNNVRNNANNNGNGFIHILKWYLRDHFHRQIPRLLELQRDYLADGPIHYWKSHKYKRADNRIASAFAQHVTDFKTGLLFGKKIKYGYQDNSGNKDAGKTFLQAVKEFNTSNDTKNHDKRLGRDALVTGRAYELQYVEANTNEPRVVRINPHECFIIWSTDVEAKELCAVRYYVVQVANRSWYEIEVYNNNGTIYHFNTNGLGGKWHLEETIKNVYNDVPITEYQVNDTRQGCFENSLDYFDAYDKAISAMANSEQDFNDTTLVVNGQVHTPKKVVQATDDNGNKLYFKPNKPHTIYNVTWNRKDKDGHPNQPAYTHKKIDTHANVLMIKPFMRNGQVVSQASANYLTKQLDANEWQVYVNELVTRIQQFTGVPNLNNDSTGNQTQLETASRLMDALNSAANAETYFRHGILRRLRLLYDYWRRVPGSPIPANDHTDPSDVTIHFDLNLPLNVQETISKIQALNGTNKVSTKTIQELAASIDGVPQSEESDRLDEEQSSKASNNANMLNTGFQSEVNASNAANNAANTSDVGDDSSEASSNASSADDNSSVSGSDDDNSDSNSGIASSSASSAVAFNNPNVDSNGSATKEAMDPNTMFDSNGSVVSMSSADADNMLAAMLLMDSMYAKSGFPSGFDSTLSNAVSTAFKSSGLAANAQSSATGGTVQ